MPPVTQTARQKILATIQELHALGWNDRAIAGEIGLHYSTVHKHRSRTLGLAPNYTPGVVRSDNKIHPHRERIVALLTEGYSDGYIARELGLNRRELCFYRRRHLKIAARPRKEQLDRDSGRRSQDRSLGRSLGEHRATVYWSIGPDLGWPEGLRSTSGKRPGCTRSGVVSVTPVTISGKSSSDPPPGAWSTCTAERCGSVCESYASSARAMPPTCRDCRLGFTSGKRPRDENTPTADHFHDES